MRQAIEDAIEGGKEALQQSVHPLGCQGADNQP
jgi:hypothetical protein